MALETFRVGYAKLFDVWIEHHYFLDFGEISFQNISLLPVDTQLALQRIGEQYDVRKFWHIQPDISTKILMQNQKMIFKPIPRGVRVGVAIDENRKPQIPFSQGLKLTFEVALNDGYFMIYTQIEKAVADGLTQMVSVIEDNETVFRKNIFRFSNQGEGVVLNTNRTIQSSDLKVFVPEVGRTSPPPLGIIEIEHSAVKSLLDNEGKVSVNPPNFRLVLANRKTRWYYRNTEVAGGMLPLVKYGRVEAELNGQKMANPTPVHTIYDAVSDSYFSHIY